MAANDKSGFWNDWKAQHPRWHLVLVLELAGIAGLSAVGLIWLFGTDIWYFWSENRDGLRDLGLTLVAVIGLPLLFWRERTGQRTANIAAERHDKQTEADRERRITDSFTKAVELLGKPELETRLGAIYALERIAHESERDHGPVMETLTAYVRTKAPAQAKAQNASHSNQSHSPDEATSVHAVAAAEEGIVEAAQGTVQASLTELAVDIQAVLTVLIRRTLKHEEKSRGINLRRANLSWADLRGVNLIRADLNEANLTKSTLFTANLTKARLNGATLIGANLPDACLNGAYLKQADLSKADLRWVDLGEAKLGEADLSGANLFGANLSKADLSKADLSGAKLLGANLSEANLREADLSGAKLLRAKIENAKFCKTIMPDGTLNNRDCPPEPAPSTPSETPPAPN